MEQSFAQKRRLELLLEKPGAVSWARGCRTERAPKEGANGACEASDRRCPKLSLQSEEPCKTGIDTVQTSEIPARTTDWKALLLQQTTDRVAIAGGAIDKDVDNVAALYQ